MAVGRCSIDWVACAKEQRLGTCSYCRKRRKYATGRIGVALPERYADGAATTVSTLEVWRREDRGSYVVDVPFTFLHVNEAVAQVEAIGVTAAQRTDAKRRRAAVHLRKEDREDC